MWWNELLKVAQQNANGLTAVLTAIMAILTLLYMVATYWLVIESRQMRRAGSSPDVVAYIKPDERFFTVINFVIRNVGHGPAYDVAFQVDAAREQLNAHGVSMPMSSNSSPISIIPQGEAITTFFGMGPDILLSPPLQEFAVTVTYRDSVKRIHVKKCIIDVRQFAGLVRTGEPADHEIAESLKEIAKHVGNFSSGFSRLKVETITTREVEDRHSQWRAEMERQQRLEHQEGTDAST